MSDQETRMKEARERLMKWGVYLFKNVPEVPDVQCLNCGRVVYCGPPCCDNPRYKDSK